MATVNAVIESLDYFFKKSIDTDFVKSKLSGLATDGEQPLLGYLAFFLAGWFYDKAKREQWVEHRLAQNNQGRVDFMIGTTALEVAVRARGKSRNLLLSDTNRDELAKLLRYRDGRALLALFDYSEDPISKSEIESYYRGMNPMHGNTKITAYNLVYFHSSMDSPIYLNIRP